MRRLGLVVFCACVFGFFGSASAAVPHRSTGFLPSSNGHASIAWDAKAFKLVQLLEHPYQHASQGVTSRDFLYDAYPGGIGFSAPLWGMQQDLLSRTRALIQGCDCETGCPMCVGPIGETGPLSKKVALRLLDHLLQDAPALQAVEQVPF